jgi:hypothetical protein
LAGNPWYDFPLLIPEREWKMIIDDEKEKILKTLGEKIVGTPR